jgi:hypothetical protein
MASLRIGIDEVFELPVRRPISTMDDTLATPLPFGNCTVDIQRNLCSVSFSYYEPPGSYVRKADVYVIQRPLDPKQPVMQERHSTVAFIGIRATTATQLFQILTDVGKYKLSRKDYEHGLELMLAAEAKWQQQRINAAGPPEIDE